MSGPVDLDAAEALFLSDKESPVLQRARRETGARLVAELRAARAKLDAIERLLQASPFGPTRAQAVATLFEIRLVATDEFDGADAP